MGAKAQMFVPKGMKRDYSASKADPQFAFENHNIRITTREDKTLLSITNEKGNSPIVLDPEISYIGIDVVSSPGSTSTQVKATLQEKVPAIGVRIKIKYLDNADSQWKEDYITFKDSSGVEYLYISKDAEQISARMEFSNTKDNMFYINGQEKPTPFSGVCVGKCIVNDYLVLFLWDNGVSRIIRLEDKGEAFTYKCLYEGVMELDPDHPLDTLGIFENNNIQKVYWVDGAHPIRMINIIEDIELTELVRTSPNYLDTVKDIPDNVALDVERIPEGNGTFNQGTIQYAVTLFREHGSESGIVAISPINYIAFTNRGANPEETVQTAFKIEINQLKSLDYYNYVRVYSIHRTSKDATPTVKVVTDMPLNGGYLECIDTNTSGYNVDPTLLLYLSRTTITGNSINQKDGTLFLGGYKIADESISEELKAEIKSKCTISFGRRATTVATADNVSENSRIRGYIYDSALNRPASEITTFKSREWYRFGVQLQYPSGKWSDVIWVGDARCNLTPEVRRHYLYVVKARLAFDNTYLKTLSSTFARIRPVVVFPQDADREVVAQGVLSSTVYSARDRFGNSPFAQSSWYFRGPLRSYSLIEATHNTGLRISVEGGEIQGTWPGSNPQVPYVKGSASSGETFSRKYPCSFYVDSSIVTFHSPDIEFDDNFGRWDSAALKLRIIGEAVFDYSTRWNILTTKGPGRNKKTAAENFTEYAGTLYGNRVNRDVNPIAGRWTDQLYGDANKGWIESFPVYTWQRSGSLGNYSKGVSGDETAVLERKIMSTLLYSNGPTYFETSSIWDASGKVTKDDMEGWELTPNVIRDNGITNIRTFNSEEISMVKIPSPQYSGLPDLSYYGNIDSLMSSFGDGRDTPDEGYEYSYPLTMYRNREVSTISYIYDGVKVFNKTDPQVKASDPISIAYKSTPHAVFAINYTSDKQQRILPTESLGAGRGAYPSFPFWVTEPMEQNIDWVTYDTISAGKSAPKLWIAELYKDTDSNLRFGGTSQKALENNTWVPCGKAMSLRDPIGFYLPCNVGDTYFQRYDCLKTYPFSDTSVNNVIEIASFLCETRVNIDGRYDQNRGLINNTAVSPKNFNLLNWAYTQNDNFFTYRLIDSKEFSLSEYPNSVIWSQTKVFGEETDSWTNLPMTSVFDLDGDKGGIVSIQKLNNELYCFQPDGLCRILYNSRSQMATLDSGNQSIPVELANTGKVEGKAYMTTGVGCSDRASIITTPTGIYFLDKDRNSLFMWGPGGLTDMTDKFSFRSWVDQIDFSKSWDPINYKGMKAFYDDTNGDVYFVTESPNSTVCYSELLGNFSSFYDYEKTQEMFSINGRFFSIRDENMWAQGAGEYNSFFGTKKPYSVEIICNTDEPVDKIFNTLEWRATVKKNGMDSQDTFNTVRVTTDGEYQDTGKVSIENMTSRPQGGMINSLNTSLRRKFRMWRIPIPRDKSNKRDRMRGPWAKIKLSKEGQPELGGPDNEKMELHDLVVHFFE